MNGALALALSLSFQQPSSPPQDLAPNRPPVVRFIHALGDDLKALPSRDTALVGLVGTIGALGLHPVDDNLADWAESEGDAGYTKVGDVLGNGFLQAGAALGTYVVGIAVEHPRTRVVGEDLVRAQILTGLVTRTLKIAVDRERPNGGGHAFPSGHASATFVSAAVLERHFGWRVGLPAYAVAGFVGWSRVRDGEHWISDVVAGATIGTVIGRTVGGRTMRSWTVVPTVSPTAVGITVVRSPL